MAIALFFIAAAVTLLGAVGVVAFRQPMRSVLSLVVVMMGLSVLFLLLSAQFVFVVQIIVYAGAVMVLFLFVIALLGPAREVARGKLRFQGWLSALFILVLLGLMWAMLQGIQYRRPENADLSIFGTVQSIGIGLFTTYLYPFELTSLLLLTAAIGAIYLSRKRIDDPDEHRRLAARPVLVPAPQRDPFHHRGGRRAGAAQPAGDPDLIELMLNAVNLTLITFSRQLENLEGQLFALMSMTVAAAEAVVGLAILVDIFHVRDVEDVDELSEMKG